MRKKVCYQEEQWTGNVRNWFIFLKWSYFSTLTLTQKGVWGWETSSEHAPLKGKIWTTFYQGYVIQNIREVQSLSFQFQPLARQAHCWLKNTSPEVLWGWTSKGLWATRWKLFTGITEDAPFRKVSGSTNSKKEASSKSRRTMIMTTEFLHSQRQCAKVLVKRDDVKEK